MGRVRIQDTPIRRRVQIRFSKQGDSKGELRMVAEALIHLYLSYPRASASFAANIPFSWLRRMAVPDSSCSVISPGLFSTQVEFFEIQATYAISGIILMMRFCWREAGTLGVALLLCLVGCEGLKDSTGPFNPMAATPTTVPDEPPPKNLKPKKAELPELPEGAGEIDADAPAELTPTPSGLYYRILRKSDGRKPTAQDRILVHCRGRFVNGREFVNSYTKGKPTEFGLTGLIKGCKEGMQLVGEGGMIELEVPYQLAFGEFGLAPDYPPRATIHFLAELKEIK
jgi:FKBP-type peptidyl-prolyl cis-trans isomerase FkpA